MIKIQRDLYIQCRNIFLRCREFDSYSALRAVFVTEELFPFRIGLSSADTPSELVDRCIEHLLQCRLKDNRPVLPIFTATLRDRYHPDDALHGDLNALHQDLESAMSQIETQGAGYPCHKQAMFESLLNIDFGEQVRLVKRTMQSHRVASFLIHGEPEFGQQVLANRLLRLAPGWSTGQRISINLASHAIGKSIRSLWRQVATKLDTSPRASSSELAQRVCEWWQTQDVVFIFHSVDFMLPDYLSQWIEDFWQPLVAEAHNNLDKTKSETLLMMFLVDYSGCVCNWDVTMAHQPEEAEYPRIPLQLPSASRFPSEFLRAWFDKSDEVLPGDLKVEEILAAAESGVPQIVYRAICDHCGLSWEGELMKWLV